jgi:phenylacetate-CoA ligase
MIEYRTIYRNFVLPLHCVLRRRSTLRWYELGQQQQRMSTDELASLQRRKLAALVEHCASHVSFYRSMFRQCGMNGHRIDSLDALRVMGVSTDKKAVREAGDSMISERSDKRRLYQMVTSGSSGVPGFFYKSLDTTCRRQAIKYRAEEWIGKPIGTRTTLIWGRLPSQKPHVLAGRWAYWWYQNYQFLSAFDIGPPQLRRYLSRIHRFRPEFVESYVTAVYQMSRFMLSEKLTAPPSIRGVIVGAEQLIDEQKRVIESAFNCPVYNRYGSTEFTNIAAECVHRRGMHVNADHILVEVVDEADRPVLDRVGEIVVTDLDSYDMPLLRYRIGDRGVLSTERCPCGLPFPMLSSINGRMSDRIVTNSGREIHDTFLIHALMRIPGVARFQVVQKSLDRVEVNLETEPNTSQPQTASTVRTKLAELVDQGMTIEVNFVPTIPLTKAGKMKYFVSELAAN